MDEQTRKEYRNMGALEKAERWEWEVVCYKKGGYAGSQVIMPIIRKKSQPDTWFRANDLSSDVKSEVEEFNNTPMMERRLGSGSYVMLEDPVPYDPLHLYVHVYGKDNPLETVMSYSDAMMDAYLAQPSTQ